ncbi:MAG: hypothetical protein QNJ20_16855, partial [Paracoccaceae bacterium]|nr:hypothetical protein [Paracoccaceae bacterium]
MLDLLRPDYRAHATFVAPALARSELWRLVVGLLLSAAIYVFLLQSVSTLIFDMLSPEGLAALRDA